MSSIPQPPGSPIQASEGCPSPLEWQDIVTEFRNQAEAWYLDRPRYRLTGRMWGSGPPLYLLNGMGGTLELYALLVWLLRDNYRCVLYDYPGTVSRGADARQASFTDYADDLLAVARQCGDDSFDLFATSFGTLVALGTMTRGESPIRHAILQGAFAHRSLSWAERALIRACQFHPGRLRHVPFRGLVQKQNHRQWFPHFDETRWQFFSENAGQVPVAALAARAGIIRDVDLRSSLPQIQQPVLLVRCEGEGLVSEECQTALEQGLPHTHTEHMHDTGHIPYLTHPHRLAKIIREFLAPAD